MGKRVGALDPDGKFVTIDEDDVPNLPEGARVLSAKEVKTRELDEEYAKSSTAQKALGIAGTALGPVASSTLTGLGAAAVDPRVAAYEREVKNAATLGLDEPLVKRGVGAVEGAPAAKAYGERVTAPGDVHEGYGTAGSLVGMTALALGGSGLGGARALATPGSALMGLGGVAEGLTGRALGGLATRGVLGRAATSAAKLAVRGAVEGGVTNVAHQAVHDDLTDTPQTGTKLFVALGHGALGGAVIGGGLGLSGSLAASGAKGLARSFSRALPKGGISETPRGTALEALDVDAGLRASPSTIEAPIRIEKGKPVSLAMDEATAIQAAEPIKIPTQKLGVADLLTKPTDAGRALAADQAWNAAGAGFGLQSTRMAKAAATYLPNGTRDVGEVSLRYGVVDIPQNAGPIDAAIHAARTGTPREMLGRAETALDGVGGQLGEMTDRSGGRVRNATLVDVIDSVAKKYESTAADRPAGRAVRAFGLELLDSLGIKSADGSVRVQDVLRERKGMDRLFFGDQPTLNPKTALAAKRDLRAAVEGAIMDSLDESSGKIAGAEKARYKALKKDYVALSILTEALEDSAARADKAGAVGLKDLAAGAMGGGLGTGTMLMLGSKLARERGNVAAAAFLSKAADRGTLAKLARSVDENVVKSAKGLFTEAKEAPSKATKELPRERAERGRAEQAKVHEEARGLVKWSADLKASPQRVLDQLKDAADLIGRTAGPNASSTYTASAIKAMNYVVSYIPVRERRDPLDPRSVPPMTYEEAERAVRAAKYATRPMSVFDDFSRGIVTPEGLHAAELFMPDQLDLFRQELFDHATNHLMRNRQLTMSRRLLLDKLGIPAIRPDAIAALQANLMGSEEPPPEKPAPSSPTGMKVQQSGFDAIEARLATG